MYSGEYVKMPRFIKQNTVKDTMDKKGAFNSKDSDSRPDLMMTLSVPFIMKKSRNGFIAECIDLNIVTQGKTITETRRNMLEALKLHLKSAYELGRLDSEIEKLGGIKKNHTIEIPKPEIEFASPIRIPC